MCLRLLDLGIDMRRDSREVAKCLKVRVDAAYLQVMYAYSSSCQLCHFQLHHCIVNDVISTGVVW